MADDFGKAIDAAIKGLERQRQKNVDALKKNNILAAWREAVEYRQKSELESLIDN